MKTISDHPSAGSAPSPRQGALFLLFVMALLFAGAATLHAQTIAIYTWVGQSSNDGGIGDGDNWKDPDGEPNAPAYNADTYTYGTGNELLVFDDGARPGMVYYSGSLNVHGLEFTGNTPYWIAGSYNDDGVGSLYLGAGGILYSPTEMTSTLILDSVRPTANQEWNIAKGRLELMGPLMEPLVGDSDRPFTLTKTGDGTLALYAPIYGESLIGPDSTIILSQGQIELHPSAGTALGDATLVFDGGTLVSGSYYSFFSFLGDYGFYDDNPVVITNPIVSNGLMSFDNENELVIASSGNESESDSVRLDADTTLQMKGATLSIEKDITDGGGGHKLTVLSDGAVVLIGASNWTGGTEVNKGTLIFGGENNTPGMTGGITVGSEGYVGIGVDNNIGGFIGEIDPASTGTIGFDSDPDMSTDTFSGDVDLSDPGLPNIRLGSASEAILTGTITPAGTSTDPYRFGGGGGYLWVNSALTGDRAVDVTSLPERPLTLLLGNPEYPELLPTNDFTGGVTVQNSALVFLPGTQPVDGNYTLQSGGYIGLMDSDSTAQADFLSRFPDTTNTGIIGFDYLDPLDTGIPMDVTIPLNFSSYAPGVYFGTHSDATFSGAITPATDSAYRFAAFKGGTLEVASPLTGSNAVYIGDLNSLGTFGSPVDEEYSTVILSGDNDYTGTTTLYTGRLSIDQTNGTVGTDPTTALGASTGALIVQPHNLSIPGEKDDGAHPLLTAEQSGIIIPNDIVLNNGLEIGGSNNFTLAGDISGPGELYLGDESFDDGLISVEEASYGYHLTLSGDNTFEGGVYVGHGNAVTFASDTAAGTGPLGFGYSGYYEWGSYAEFSSQHPVIGGLWSDGSYAEIDLSYEGERIFTINQAESGVFRGDIYGDGSSTIIKNGPGTLRLDDVYIYSDGIDDGDGHNIGLDIQQGTVVFSNGSELYDSSEYHSTAIKVSGGTLAADGDTTIYNPILIDSGRLAGFGTFASNVSIGDGAILSPGLRDYGQTGLLNFYHLELNSGGIYEFNVQDPDPFNSLGQDRISVVQDPELNQSLTLVINADETDPFIIKTISLDSSGQKGLLAGFDPSQYYSWILIDYNSLDLPFNADVAALFTVDHSEFLNSLSFDERGDGYFSVSLDSEHSQLMLNFSPVPEPSTYALLGLGLGFIAWTAWQRRRRHD